MAEAIGLTVGELRATMTLPEFLCWQTYYAEKHKVQARPAPAELPELGAIGPAGIAAALR